MPLTTSTEERRGPFWPHLALLSGLPVLLAAALFMAAWRGAYFPVGGYQCAAYIGESYWPQGPSYHFAINIGPPGSIRIRFETWNLRIGDWQWEVSRRIR